MDGHHFVSGYDSGDCTLTADGQRLAWPADNPMVELVITHSADGVRVKATGRLDDWSFDVEIAPTTSASWFVTAPVYEHFSLLAAARGVIDQGASTEVNIDTRCTFEFARGRFPQGLLSRPYPERLRLPADYVVYQVINLQSAQLLIGDLGAAGVTVRRSASL